MNTGLISENKVKRFKLLITIASIAIPLVVAVLFKVKIEGVDLSFLPPIYAGINGLTAILLFWALMAIKSGKRVRHERLINACMVLSLLFLACYVAYHMTSDSTPYGGTGTLKYVYYFILLTHILLSVAVVPLVLFSYLFAWQGNYERHRKWTKITWPLWFYVAVSGVIVYLMISPYYTH
jgi:putative membrane protein